MAVTCIESYSVTLLLTFERWRYDMRGKCRHELAGRRCNGGMPIAVIFVMMRNGSLQNERDILEMAWTASGVLDVDLGLGLDVDVVGEEIDRNRNRITRVLGRKYGFSLCIFCTYLLELAMCLFGY